jgi:hypothetical protein
MVLARIRLAQKEQTEGSSCGAGGDGSACQSARGSAPCSLTYEDSIRLGSLLGLTLEGSGSQGGTRHLPLLLEVLQQPHVVVNGLA